jgi:hypothetical protein
VKFVDETAGALGDQSGSGGARFGHAGPHPVDHRPASNSVDHELVAVLHFDIPERLASLPGAIKLRRIGGRGVRLIRAARPVALAADATKGLVPPDRDLLTYASRYTKELRYFAKN